ncbi:MAG: carboxypeptidase-like regulatory domain-containing protein [Chitinophagaceae bacterium]|nr:MAG: carboxypeptidase-like regulatory domain-containing protein [Chitinophagaceae bacterium]
MKFIDKKQANFCVILDQNQLNIKLHHPQQNTYRSRLYKILATLLFAGTTQSTFATDNKTPAEIETIIQQNTRDLSETFDQKKIEDSTTHAIKGHIKDAHTNEDLPFASIRFKDTKIGTVSDLDGNFKLNIPDTLKSDSIFIIIQNVGYEEQVIAIDKSDTQILIELIPNENRKHDIIYVGNISVQEKKWWQFWR